MKDITDGNFGVIIAFWLPGSILLWALSYSSSFHELAVWLSQPKGKSEEISIGAFLFVTVASLSLGMVLSAIRWFFVDHFLYWFTGLRRPTHTFGKLRDRDVREAFNALNENHYRYYQYYANTLIAVALGLGFLWWSGSTTPITTRVLKLSALLALVLLIAARDALSKYNDRVAQLLA